VHHTLNLAIALKDCGQLLAISHIAFNNLDIRSEKAHHLRVWRVV
jgi:hypothetical protein